MSLIAAKVSNFFWKDEAKDIRGFLLLEALGSILAMSLSCLNLVNFLSGAFSLRSSVNLILFSKTDEGNFYTG